MKFLFPVLLLIFSTNALAQTQSAVNTGKQQSFASADKELNAIYQKILQSYKTDAAFVKNLKVSQKIWVQFRDAEVKMKYPDRAQGYYGSSLAACRADYLTGLTNDRIKTLRVWVDGIEEGDLCAGSVKKK